MIKVRLSVVMSNYNHSHFLKERIFSILSQMTDNDEFIIVDDASTDHSVSIIEEFLKQDTRLKLIKNEKNLGVVRSANGAAHLAKGEYLTFLAADDQILPGFINKTMGMLLKHPEIGICCSDCASRYEGFPDKSSDKIYSAHLVENAKKPLLFPPPVIRNIFWTTFFWIPGHTAIMKKELFLKYGGIQERLGHLCDWFLMHCIALNEGVAYIPETLAVWREDANSYSHRLGGHRKHRRKFQLKLFDVLSEKGNESLRSLFVTSGLLHYHIRPNLIHFIVRPYYWDFLFSFVKRYLFFKREKFFKELR